MTSCPTPPIKDIVITSQDPELIQILKDIRQIIEIREGRLGDNNCRFISYYELLELLTGDETLTVTVLPGAHTHSHASLTGVHQGVDTGDSPTFAALSVVGAIGGDNLTLGTGATVDTIETTLTDDDTHLPTSGAVFDAIAGIASNEIVQQDSRVRVTDTGGGPGTSIIEFIIDFGQMAYITDAGWGFAAGATVNHIETSVTNDDTRLATSGAIFDALAGVEPLSLFFGSAAKVTAITDGFSFTDGTYTGDITMGNSPIPGTLVINNQYSGGMIELRGNNSPIFRAIENSSSWIYHKKQPAIITSDGGFDMKGNAGSHTTSFFLNPDGSLRIQNWQGLPIRLRSGGGLGTLMMELDPAGAIKAYHAGVQQTETLASGLAILLGRLQTALAGALDLTIACGTDKTLVLEETVYKDINLGAALLSTPASSAPDTDTFSDEAGVDTGINTYAFAVGELVSGSFEIQHDYKEGSDLSFHIHWQGKTAPAGGTDNVQWELNYTIARNGATLDAVTTLLSGDGAITAQYQEVTQAFADISGTTGGNNGGQILVGDQFLFTLERVAATADEYGGDALIMTLGVHYEVDTLGSRQQITK